MSPRHASARGQSSMEDGQTVRVGSLVDESFPLAPLSLVIESLRVANWVEGGEVFSHSVVSADGEPRTSSSGFPVKADYGVSGCPSFDVLLVCTGQNSSQINDSAVLNWLRRSHRQGGWVGAISGGAFVLARAGLLQNRSCAVHWESGIALAEAFSDVTVCGDIFVIDGRVITCAGGISTLDLMLHLIEVCRGRTVSRRVADALIYPQMRDGNAPARIDLHRRTGVSNSVLLRAIELMENNLEEPMKVSEISACVGDVNAAPGTSVCPVLQSPAFAILHAPAAA